MSNTLLFVPNDRVWVFSDDAWWPAKVLDPAEAEMVYGSQMPPDQDYVVMFYGEEPCLGYHLAAHLEAFEDSSGKAVTTDAALKLAIKMAAEDTNANPLHVVAQPSMKRPADRPDRGAASTTAAPNSSLKRARKEVSLEDSHIGGDDGDCYPRGAQGYRFESVSFFMEIEKRLRSAIREGDAAAVRKQLLKLDHVKITREQLSSTKIGVAIGDVLGDASLSNLWPLAQALINWFVLSLPRQTLQAIQHFRDANLAQATNLAEAKDTVAAAQAAAATNSFNQRQPTTTATRMKALEKIIAAFRADVEASGASLSSTGSVETLVEAFFSSIRTSDHKRLFISDLAKPGHRTLRRRILDGSLTGEAFSRLTPADLVTDEEKAAEDEKILAAIAAQEEEDKINSIGTTMFECPNCKKKNATYHEQQTRGADEPTTKFVNCLECKHRWTTE